MNAETPQTNKKELSRAETQRRGGVSAESPRLCVSARVVFLLYFLSTGLIGCQTNAKAPDPVVTSTRDAAARAAQYCHDHNLFWGQPVYIIQQMDGYYVEFVNQNGYKQDTHGLTVAYDGSVHE